MANCAGYYEAGWAGHARQRDAERDIKAAKLAAQVALLEAHPMTDDQMEVAVREV